MYSMPRTLSGYNGSIYANTARFDANRWMTEDEIHAAAPSVFATTAHESRSDRFRPIPTIEVVRALANEGFQCVAAKQAITRVEGKAPFTKHLLRFRRFDNLEAYRVGDTVCETLLKNANDGTSAYELLVGLFRIRCMNSMVAKTATIDEIKIRHSGDAIGKVIEGNYRVLNEAQQCLEAPRVWSQLALPAPAREAYAKAAHVLRFADADGNVNTAIEPAQLLEPRRYDDRGTDVWSTFQVVQENAIRGGLSRRGTDANGHRRMFTSREVKGIDQDVRLNKALWVLTEELAKAVQ